MVRILKARDIERLENTSFASAAGLVPQQETAADAQASTASGGITCCSLPTTVSSVPQSIVGPTCLVTGTVTGLGGGEAGPVGPLAVPDTATKPATPAGWLL